jgi:hypothetical protein
MTPPSLPQSLRRPKPIAGGFRLAVVVAALLSGRPAAAAAPETACRPFIGPAERFYRLPAGLLEAIALTESGRDGNPFPWALNIGGQPVMANGYQAAAALLRWPDGTPRRDVAVGCMQIHMQYHLERFGAPEWALQPANNVWYGAMYLQELRQHYGDWVAAVAHYHGSDPAAERDYLCRVALNLAATAPTTGAALGLTSCAVVPPHRAAAGPRRGAAAGERARLAMMNARRLGSIIVLGVDR